MKVAKYFQSSYELGMRLQRNPKDNKDTDAGKSTKRKKKKKTQGEIATTSNRGDPAGNGDANREKGRKGQLKDKKGSVVNCVYCGDNHYVTQFKKVPEEKRDWTFKKHLETKRKKDSQSPTSGSKKSKDGTQPGGDESSRHKTPEKSTGSPSETVTRGVGEKRLASSGTLQTSHVPPKTYVSHWI